MNRCNSDLLNGLIREGVLRSSRVICALSTVDRAHYAPHRPYDDSPQTIGYGATISAPHMHAYALEALLDKATAANACILDVGCGSGFLSVAFARLNPSAKVYGIDYIDELVQLSITNIKKQVHHHYLNFIPFIHTIQRFH